MRDLGFVAGDRVELSPVGGFTLTVTFQGWLLDANGHPIYIETGPDDGPRTITPWHQIRSVRHADG